MNETALSQHVVVFGFRGVARRIVKQLAETGIQILVVEQELAQTERDTLARYGVQWLDGFGQSEEVQRAAGVERARAAICATDDDLRNIEVALLVRELSPSVRIVVQMARPAVAEALQSVATPGAVLEVAQLASTAFVEMATGRTTHEIDFNGETFLTATVRAPRAGTLREIWGEIAPIAVRPADGAALITCPSRDLQIATDDVVTLLGTREQLAEVGINPEASRGVRVARSWQRRLREAWYAVFDALDRPFRISVAVLGVLALASIFVLTAGYRNQTGGRMSPLDAIYFTAETIATVGFGDFSFRDQETWLRAWAILLILLGATLVTVVNALLTNALVGRRLEQSLGVQRLTGMRDHIVIIGLGAVGSKVAAELRAADFEVAVIDSGEGTRFIPQMRKLGVPVYIGDATLRETQISAGVDRAAGVAVLTSDDLVNIETGLAVRGVVGNRPVPIALRLFGRNLARVVGRGLDAGVARSVAELSAPWFVGAALGLDVVGTFYVGDKAFVAARVEVAPGDGFDGRAIKDMSAQTRVVGIRRRSADTLEHPLQRETVCGAGDTAYVVGQFEDLLDLFQRG